MLSENTKQLLEGGRESRAGTVFIESSDTNGIKAFLSYVTKENNERLRKIDIVSICAET